jgi:hypothetical protein
MTGLDNGLTRMTREAELEHFFKLLQTNNCQISYFAVFLGE